MREPDDDDDEAAEYLKGRWLDTQMGGTKAHVSVYPRHDVGLGHAHARSTLATTYLGPGGHPMHCTVSFNPARLNDPDGWTVCPPELVEGYAHAIVIQLARAGVVVAQCPHVDLTLANAVTAGAEPRSERVIPIPTRKGSAGWRLPWCEDQDCLSRTLSVSRIDVTMDFLGVQDTSLWVDVFEGHPQTGAGKTKRRVTRYSAYARRGDNGLRVAIYDKAVQSARRKKSARAPAGTLRVEVTARSPALKSRMLDGQIFARMATGRAVTHKRRRSRKLALLTPRFITQLFVEGFEWAGLDRWIGGGHPLRASRGNELTPLIAERLRAFLDGRAGGLPQNDSPTTKRDYEGRSARFGYIVGVPRSQVTGPLRHLDLRTKTEALPDVDWRRHKGWTGSNSGAARTVLRRRSHKDD
ncbi:MAG: hypothetical protein JWL79_154 [Frankiales bacterium]|nr:hypothetical protein [Frankiales bacterium]